jgi:homospermidine synthase
MVSEAPKLRTFVFWRGQTVKQMRARTNLGVSAGDLALLAFQAANFQDGVRLEELGPSHWRIVVQRDALADVSDYVSRWAPLDLRIEVDGE